MEEPVKLLQIKQQGFDPVVVVEQKTQQEIDIRLYWLDEHGNITYITEEELAESIAIEEEFKR